MSGDAPAPASGGTGDAGSTPAATPATPAAAPETAAPQSTADIATRVIERADQAPDPREEEPAAPAQTAAERFTEEEQLLRQYGFKRAKRDDGSEHTIPRSKVLSMIASGLKRGRDQWNSEKTQLDTELQTLRQFRDGFAEQLRGNEDQFIAYIAQHDPRYRRYLERQEQREPQREAAGSDEPQADLDLGDGRRTFSPQGLQKWLAWAVEQRLQERLAPLTQAHEEQQRRQAYEQAQTQMRERVRTQMDEAVQWPNWNDYADAVLEKLQADTAEAQKSGGRPKMTLREAYLEAKADYLSQGVNQARERVLGDLQHAPRATGVRSNGEIPRQVGPRTTQDIARANLARAERNGG